MLLFVVYSDSGIGAKGYYPTGMISVGDRAMKSGYRELTPTLKKLLMLGEYVNVSQIRDVPRKN